MSNEVNMSDNSDEIVITGMSGLFPNSKNIKEFEYNLYNKIDMTDDQETRWKHVYPETPRTLGKVPTLNKFDAIFFGVYQAQANKMDAQMRIILEEAYKAVMDAGVNPTLLRGTNTGVYVVSSTCDVSDCLMYDENSQNGLGLLGTTQALLANRISFALGLNGASVVCDTACSSSLYALSMAYEHMKSGKVDAAIVGGANLLMNPHASSKFCKLGVLSTTGKCRPFDESADGYIRSESINCIFLQKKRNAKRIYATLVHCTTNCDGYKPEGLTYPSSKMQAKLMSNFYKDINFDLNDLGYMEAHCTGTVVGDPEECAAIDKAICSKRKMPLLIGSVKSNCGHSEAVSGLNSLVKALITFNNNLIPPNINLTKLRISIDALQEGRLKVVTEKTELTEPYVCINSFGFGGANAHCLLKQWEDKTQVSSDKKKIDLPYIMTWSGRTLDIVNRFFDGIESRPFNIEHLALLRSSQAGGIQGMVYRGYSILEKQSILSNPEIPTVLSRSVKYNEGVKRPVVWVFSGMGSQWSGMGKDLMKIQVCSDSILRSHTTLKLKGLDLIKIITADDPNTFENVLYSFVGIAAIQIALVDLLHELQLKPDYIIGHSVGELGCAYADGCFTAEQTILSSYYRGKVSIDLEKTHGSMAAIGMSFKDIQNMLPSNIDVACHNSCDSCTISGPSSDISSFLKCLKLKNIFAKEVASANIAYHSRYIQQFGPQLLKYLKKLIPNPKLRSGRWISTSVPIDEWLHEKSKYCSAEYFTNNLLKSVLFEEGSACLPANSLTIEISPHALLQSILKSCNPNAIHIGLTKRNCKDSVLYLLEALGNLYINGLELCLDSLYPSVQWPVSRGVPTISDQIELDHTNDYKVYFYEDKCAKYGIKNFPIYLNAENKYLYGHEIDGRPLVPATFYIECVWKVFAIMHGVADFRTIDAEFENVQFLRATTLSNQNLIEFDVSIQRGSGTFEVTESKTLVVKGVIHRIAGQSQLPLPTPNKHVETVKLTKKDFYKELKLRGYHYKDVFQSVEMAYADGSYGKIKWFNNWVTFMDCMLQMAIIRNDSRNLALPVKLRSLRIFANYHTDVCSKQSEIEVYSSGICLTAGGIEITDLKASHVQRRKPPGEPVLEKYQFVPYFQAPGLSDDDISRCCIQLYLEKFSTIKCLITQVSSSTEKDFVFLKGLIQTINDLPTIQSSNMILDMSNNENCDLYHELKESINVSIVGSVYDLEGNINILLIDEADLDENFSDLQQKLSKDSFILIRTTKQNNFNDIKLPENCVFVALYSSSTSPNSIMIVLTSTTPKEVANQRELEIFLKIAQYDNKFQWIEKLKDVIGRKVVLISENEPYNGLLGLVNCLKKEPETQNIRCVFINDVNAPEFNPSLDFYKNQLDLGWAINIYHKGKWGCYRHLELKPSYPIMEHKGLVRGAIKNIGEFSTLHWQTEPFESADAKVRIVYSALNFRDVMHASGRLSAEDIGLSRLEQSSIFGLEYSGIDLETGRPIMGMINHSSIASFLLEHPIVSWEVPQKWSLREAATVPVVYTTVYYAFFYTVDIRSGKDILIHSGSGGVGIAAIRTAIAYGLEVYTTVSNVEKKNFLLQNFPQLKEENIGNSRDCSFEDMIRVRTNGRGVDFVLNSLSEDKLKASLRCLAPNGHFLEIGKFDMANDSPIGLGVFFQGQNFHAVLADKLTDYAPHLLKKLEKHIEMDIQNGIVQPLPSTVFKPHELEQAFRYLMTAKHIGKVVIEVRPNVESPTTHLVSATPKVYFNKQLVYIVPGGLGGFGLELVDWMILRGARKVVLNSRHGLTDNYQRFRISIWKSYNCKITVNTSDITKEDGCLELLTESMKMGNIGGILNLAVVLKDGIFSNQTMENFQQSLAPKAFATIYLDKLSRKLCPKLHCFVIFSSVSCGRGNAGQTNYGMANSIMERVIEERVSLGLPGKAIQWGAVGEVGLVAVMAEGKIDLNIGGTLQQRISSCLQVMDTLLTSPDPIVSSMVVAEKKIIAHNQTALQFVMSVLSLPQLNSISVTSTLSELGMDSLLGVEIKQTLERNYDIVLTTAELRLLTIERLRELSDLHNTKNNDVQVNGHDEDKFNIIDSLYFNVGLDLIYNEYMIHLNNIGSNDIPLIIIPGFEGIYTDVWGSISDNIKAPTYLIQFQINFESHNFENITEAVLQNILNVLNCRKLKSFRIAAYSFGTIIAHYVIKNLENLGYSGSVIYIDGSPYWLETIGSSIRKHNSIELKKYICLQIVKNISETIKVIEFENALLNSFNQDVILFNIKKVLTKYNIENIHYYINIIKSVLFLTEVSIDPETFKAIDILESKILLIKPSTLLNISIDTFYGLQALTRNTLKHMTVEGDHQTMLKNESLPKLINQFFGIE